MCIVGAGVAGLVAAKVFKEDGFDVAVYEKEPTIGGVWAPSRTYPSLRTNGPRESYAFSDFPYPASTDEFPTAEQVRSYLGSYVEHFGLRQVIHLSTEVVNVSRAHVGASQPRFQISVRRVGESKPPLSIYADFVTVCNGVFSEPYLPSLRGRERFAGQVLHSSQLADAQVLEGRRIVVIGAGKSALDCAVLASNHGKSCVLVLRRPHWMVPRYFFGLIRMDRLLMTRFSELFLRYHRRSRLEALLHGSGKGLVRAFWRLQNRLVPHLLKMPAALLPEQPLPSGFENVGVGGEFYRVLRQGRLRVQRSRSVSFAGPRSIELDNGEQVQADVLIFGTGWKQDLRLLDPELRAVVLKQHRLHLYRHILPPEEPHLGFVGYASSIASPFTAEMGAHWLSQCFRGELKLPAVAAMEREISRVHQWASEVFPGRDTGYFLGPYVAHYTDELMRDMGLRIFRKGRNRLVEYFGPFWPERYRDVSIERRRARR